MKKKNNLKIVNNLKISRKKVEELAFKGVLLKNAEIINCKLIDFELNGSELKICNLSNTDFNNIDLRQSVLDGAKIDINNFKQITICPPQIIYFASQYKRIDPAFYSFL